MNNEYKLSSSCISCKKAREELGATNLYFYGNGKGYDFYNLIPQKNRFCEHVNVSGNSISLFGLESHSVERKNIINLLENLQLPWYCFKCARQQCLRCGSQENPFDCLIFNPNNELKYHPVSPFRQPCSNPKCRRSKITLEHF